MCCASAYFQLERAEDFFFLQRVPSPLEGWMEDRFANISSANWEEKRELLCKKKKKRNF